MCHTAPIEKVLDTPSRAPITELLRAWGDGNDSALEQLTPLVEAELRRQARAYMRRERRGHTLQTTALVNEAFLRLTDARQVRWQDRAHFLALSARLMRRVLVDHARSRGYRKRGGGAERVTLDEELVASPEPPVDVLALDRALEALAAVDARKSRVIELRFFGGLSVEETADVLHVSPDTVKRDWRLAKLWLLRELELQQEAGFQPLKVIQHATVNNAKILGQENSLGRIRVGFKADIIVVNGNPLKDLKVLYPTGVDEIQDGKIIKTGGVEWTIKDGIPFYVPAIAKEIREMVANARKRS